MSHNSAELSRGMTLSLTFCAWLTDDSGTCSFRTAAAKIAVGRNGSKESLTRCEADAFLLLTPGHRIVVLVHETGEIWHGSVDTLFSQQGFVWIITDFGERKLIDIALHTIWQAEIPSLCGSRP